ncbi:hypothetical protein GCM10023151_04260 [Kangiella marina]|uniref:Uncharacterized protein n=1 Tax=Kangiella marina TaxID=1079178 RepID=A0ABP8IDT5_9GAMM
MFSLNTRGTLANHSNRTIYKSKKNETAEKLKNHQILIIQSVTKDAFKKPLKAPMLFRLCSILCARSRTKPSDKSLKIINFRYRQGTK